MKPPEIAALLGSAPESHSRRCALAKNAIETRRWPAAAGGLRIAASLAQEWATKVRTLADWCATQSPSTRADQDALDALELQDLLTPEEALSPDVLEAGLMALAHSMGREHAIRTRRAMNEVLAAKFDPPADPDRAGHQADSSQPSA